MTHRVRLINDPLHGQIDVGAILPVIETRQFQALADKRQLGMTPLVFRNARHTRFEHSLGAYRATRDLGHVWVRRGWIDERARDALAVFALLHDTGHPAFSHVTEDFCRVKNDERSAELIENELREEIAKCGVDPDFVARLARHKLSISRAVHDKNLGMEKLDYLERDGYYTGLGRPAGIDALRKYVLLVEGQLAIDEKMVDNVVDVMSYYVRMYKEVYFRKALVIAQRMFHKAIYHLILSKELDPESLFDLTDTELLGGHIYCSTNPVVQEMYQRLRNRDLFCEAVVIRSETTVCETRVQNKAIKVMGVFPEVMQRLVNSTALDKSNHAGLEVLERLLEETAGLPMHSVLVVPVFNPERFEAQDVMIHGSDGGLHSLRARRPAHFSRLEETARSYTALRICTTREYRDALSRASSAVLEQVLWFA